MAQPFTSDGVQALQKQLYALSDADLQTQANEARTNFKAFLTSNFEFTADQTSYVSGLDAKFFTEFGGYVATALENRLPINVATSGNGTPSGKLIHTTSVPIVTHTSSGTTATGTLGIGISYS